MIFTACHKEKLNQNTLDFNLTVQEAQSYLVSTNGNSLVLKSKSFDHKKYKPNWDLASLDGNEYVDVVETPIQSYRGFGFLTQESYEKWHKNKDYKYTGSMTRLVVLHYKKTNKTVSFLMTIIGDSEYLEQVSFKIYKNTYLKKEKDFCGLVLFHDLEGMFVNGWRFTDGKVSHKLKSGEDIDLQLKSNDCVVISIYEWYTDCEYWIQLDGFGNVYYYTTGYCSPPYPEYRYDMVMCYVHEEDFSSGAGGSGSTGGTSGGYIPPPTQSEIDPGRLFDLSKMLVMMQNLVYEAFDEMNSNCVFYSMNNWLINNNVRLGGIKI